MGADIPASHAAGSPSDDELLAAARQGDTAALETLLVRYQPHLYRFGLRMCGNVEDAGDVAQESLISMARSVRDFRGDSSVSSWLYTIARRFCIKKRRRSKFAPDARRVAGRARNRRCPAPRRSEAEPGADSDQSGTGDRSHARHRRTGTLPARGAGAARRRRVIGAGSGQDPGHERRGRQEPAAPGEGRHP